MPADADPMPSPVLQHEGARLGPNGGEIAATANQMCRSNVQGTWTDHIFG
jgi:hypothetical protein